MSACTTNEDCPFLYHCDSQFECNHDDILPPNAYTIVFYLLIPFAVGAVNIAGNSMGIFKIILLVLALRYTIAQSTVLVHPMAAGAALPNFFNIVFKRHPSASTTLIDYNILSIVIPCSMAGSALGSFLQSLIPQLFQAVLLIIAFSYFAYKYVKKLGKYKQKQEESKNPILQQKFLIAD